MVNISLLIDRASNFFFLPWSLLQNRTAINLLLDMLIWKGGNFLLENSGELSILGIVGDNYRWGDFMSDLWSRKAQCSFSIHYKLDAFSLPSYYLLRSILPTQTWQILGILVHLGRSCLRCDDLGWGWNEIAIITPFKDRIMPASLRSQIISSQNYHHFSTVILRNSHWAVSTSHYPEWGHHHHHNSG